jgi:hypothetical protein
LAMLAERPTRDDRDAERARVWRASEGRRREAASAHVYYVYACWELRKMEEAAGLPVAPVEDDHWRRTLWP